MDRTEWEVLAINGLFAAQVAAHAEIVAKDLDYLVGSANDVAAVVPIAESAKTVFENGFWTTRARQDRD